MADDNLRFEQENNSDENKVSEAPEQQNTSNVLEPVVEHVTETTEIPQNQESGTPVNNIEDDSNKVQQENPSSAHQNSARETQGTYYSYTPNQNFEQYNSQNYGYYGPNYNLPKKKKKGGKIAIIIIAVTAAVAVLSVLGIWAAKEVSHIFGNEFGVVSNTAQTNSGAQENKNDKPLDDLVINSKPSGSDEFSVYSDGTMTPAAVIEKVRPSIVGIVQYKNSQNGIPTVNGEGSGIIISKDGYIVTNAHVVEGATMITVVLDNNEEYRATLKGIDTQTDLAVIKIDKTGLPAAELGDSSQTVLGESVIAIGNPGGLELAGSCTGGMVSGLNRTFSSESVGYAMTYIQTDAAINPGNSGGALVNMYGQVIGINSAKIVAEGYEGLGFAISINEAIPIVNDLQRYGYVKNRAKIGIGFQLITETVSQYYNYTIPAGLLVTVIDEDCDIATKDIEINDIITKIDGNDITSANVVYNVLQKKKPGDTVKLTVYRIGTRLSTSKTFDVTVVLSEDKGQN